MYDWLRSFSQPEGEGADARHDLRPVSVRVIRRRHGLDGRAAGERPAAAEQTFKIGVNVVLCDGDRPSQRCSVECALVSAVVADRVWTIWRGRRGCLEREGIQLCGDVVYFFCGLLGRNNAACQKSQQGHDHRAAHVRTGCASQCLPRDSMSVCNDPEKWHSLRLPVFKLHLHLPFVPASRRITRHRTVYRGRLFGDELGFIRVETPHTTSWQHRD